MSNSREKCANERRAESPPVHHPFPMVVFGISLYCIVSVSIVFLNRRLFSNTFRYPVFVSWLQQAVGLTVYYVVAVFGAVFPKRKFFPLVQFSPKVARQILPLSLSFVGMIGFSNTCLKFVQVSTYQVARSLTLLFNLALSSLMIHQHISLKSWLACLVVISGFVVGSLDPSTLSALGVLTGAASSLFQAFYTVSIKKCLSAVNDDHNVLLFYNLLLSTVFFIPIIFVAGEGGFIHELPSDIHHPDFMSTWISLIGSGLLGISLTFASYLCVKVTSPVTFNVVGYAKACIQSLGGIVLLGEVFNIQSLSGILLTLVGSFWYSQVKMSERFVAEKSSGIQLSSAKELEDNIEKSDTKV